MRDWGGGGEEEGRRRGGEGEEEGRRKAGGREEEGRRRGGGGEGREGRVSRKRRVSRESIEGEYRGRVSREREYRGRGRGRGRESNLVPINCLKERSRSPLIIQEKVSDQRLLDM